MLDNTASFCCIPRCFKNGTARSPTKYSHCHQTTSRSHIAYIQCRNDPHLDFHCMLINILWLVNHREPILIISPFFKDIMKVVPNPYTIAAVRTRLPIHQKRGRQTCPVRMVFVPSKTVTFHIMTAWAEEMETQ